MPKMKTHSGAKKRFKKTAGGKIRARHAFSSHILEKKSPKKKRAFALTGSLIGDWLSLWNGLGATAQVQSSIGAPRLILTGQSGTLRLPAKQQTLQSIDRRTDQEHSGPTLLTHDDGNDR